MRIRFWAEYRKGEDLVVPDALSRLYEGEENNKWSTRIKEARREKLEITENGKLFWKLITVNGER